MDGEKKSEFSATLSILYIVSICLCFISAYVGAAEDVELQGNLDRIKYYESALEDQREALSICTQNIGATLEAYSAAVADGDSNTVAAKNREYISLEGLRNLYLNKILDTMLRLAREHEQASTKQQAMRLYRPALDQISAAAELFDRRGKILEQQASEALQEALYDTAAPRYEQAYGAYRGAEGYWNRALQLHSMIDAGDNSTEHRHRRENSHMKGVGVLRAAANAYFNSYQIHKEKASTQNIDIYRRDAGDAWRLTAQAQQNYERLQKVLKQLTRP